MTLFWIAVAFAVYLLVCYIATGVAGFNDIGNVDDELTTD
jgi:hypothetical protein